MPDIFTADAWADLGERLTRSAASLADLRDEASPADEPRLDAKRTAVLAVHDHWKTIPEQNVHVLREWIIARMNLASGGQREGLSLALDYLRA